MQSVMTANPGLEQMSPEFGVPLEAHEIAAFDQIEAGLRESQFSHEQVISVGSIALGRAGDTSFSIAVGVARLPSSSYVDEASPIHFDAEREAERAVTNYTFAAIMVEQFQRQQEWLSLLLQKDDKEVLASPTSSRSKDDKKDAPKLSFRAAWVLAA